MVDARRIGDDESFAVAQRIEAADLLLILGGLAPAMKREEERAIRSRRHMEQVLATASLKGQRHSTRRLRLRWLTTSASEDSARSLSREGRAERQRQQCNRHELSSRHFPLNSVESRPRIAPRSGVTVNAAAQGSEPSRSIRSTAFRMVKSFGSRDSLPSCHVNGIDTVAPGSGRTLKGATISCPWRFCRKSR